MKIAVSAWNGRVAPVFDSSEKILLAEGDGLTKLPHSEGRLSQNSAHEKVGKLREFGVDVLICGAVSTSLAAMIEAAGIRLIPWVVGFVDEVLAAYLDGSLLSERFRMPGCPGYGRRGCGSRGRRTRGGYGSGKFGGQMP